MLGCSLLINTAVLILASYILHVRIHLLRLLCWSAITGVITVAEYLLMLGRNRLLHHILYVGIYIIMTIIYFGRYTGKEILLNLLSVLLSMLLLYGMLAGLSLTRHRSLGVWGISIIISMVLLLCAAILIACRKHVTGNAYRIRLVKNTKSITCNAYMDSGNVLRDRYNGSPVIVLDYRLMRRILSSSGYRLIEQYHETGDFDYAAFSETETIRMYPLPYQTVSAGFAVMPAFRLTSLIFLGSGEEISGVTAGVSRYQFMNHKYQILLNENLKPNREEYSND